ncbi:hypothetical protein BN1095_4150002 [Clostridioides difficile]|uniref:Uncharacterized protein n=1 Tax=Clostridioides difficile TaxID=1496 RepID=A0A069APZ2_CLODI|nr:hypothetical protein BN1095_4150002 [Clostridioides difficile]
MTGSISTANFCPANLCVSAIPAGGGGAGFARLPKRAAARLSTALPARQSAPANPHKPALRQPVPAHRPHFLLSRRFPPPPHFQPLLHLFCCCVCSLISYPLKQIGNQNPVITRAR